MKSLLILKLPNSKKNTKNLKKIKIKNYIKNNKNY